MGNSRKTSGTRPLCQVPQRGGVVGWMSIAKAGPLCSAPMIVTTAAIVHSPTASAAIVSSGIVNFEVPTTNLGTDINFATVTVQNSTGTHLPGWDLSPYGTSTNNVALLANHGTGIMRNPSAGTNTLRTNLAIGTVVGPSGFYYGNSAASLGTAVGQWTANAEGYIGVKFFSESTSSVHYGFMALRIRTNATDRTIVGFAWESIPDTPIVVSTASLPAPATGLIALAAGCGGRRRRR